MKKIILLLSIVSFVFVSCTDNTEIVKKDEISELQSINKDDDTHKGGDGEEPVDNGED